MRPKLIALLAVSAFAIVGCSASDDPSNPQADASKQAAEKSQTAVDVAKKNALRVYDDGSFDMSDPQTGKTIRMDKNGFEIRKPKLVKVEDIESDFISLVEGRAPVHAVTDLPSDKVLVKSFHAYCENGVPMNFSSEPALNENVETVTKDGLCDDLKFVGKPVKELEASRRG